jgi:hypothetical protein
MKKIESIKDRYERLKKSYIKLKVEKEYQDNLIKKLKEILRLQGIKN